MPVTSNAAEFQRSVRNVSSKFAFASRKAASRAGTHMRDSIREEIPKSRGQAAGRFEGYAASGRLWHAVVATDPKRRMRAGDWEVTVGIRDSAQLVYAHIHNVGGIIRAKPDNRAGGYLVFQVKGQWVKVKQVRIRRKNYMADGYNRGLRTLPARIAEEFVRQTK